MALGNVQKPHRESCTHFTEKKKCCKDMEILQRKKHLYKAEWMILVKNGRYNYWINGTFLKCKISY